MCHHCTTALQRQGLTPDHLQLLPYKIVKWKCCIVGCNRGTFVHDYEIGPFYFSPRKGSGWGWMDISEHWLLCGRHWKKYQASPGPPGYGRTHVGEWHELGTDTWQQLILPTNRKPAAPWQAIVPPGAESGKK